MKKLFAAFLIALFSLMPAASAAVRTGDGTKTVATAGTAVALASSQSVTQVAICGDSNNTGKIIIGSTPVQTPGAQEGAVISAGSCVGISVDSKNAFDLADIKIDSTVSGEEASYFWILERD